MAHRKFGPETHSKNEDFPVGAVPELMAHGTGLPYLPKLVMSRLRTGREAKSDKDVVQASVLCAALAESHPGAVESAVEKIPRRARKYLKPAIESARRYIEQTHPRAWEELRPGLRIDQKSALLEYRFIGEF